MAVGFTVEITVTFVEQCFGEQRIVIDENVMINLQKFAGIARLQAEEKNDTDEDRTRSDASTDDL